MSNGLKFRKPQQQRKTTNQGVARNVGTPLGHQEDAETERLLNQIQEVLDRSGKAKSGSAAGGKDKKRKAPRKQRTKSRIDQGQAPPGQGRRRAGGRQEDEFDRVIAMLEIIRKTSETLASIAPRVVPQELHPSITQSWHSADEGFKAAIATLQNKTQRVELKPKLEAAGFTGEMLDMKETSFNYHMARVDKAILTYNNSETTLEKFVRWIRPGVSVINSVLGSLSTIPGVEVGKEFKEHLESAYEVVETSQVE
jgi:hypothetical protein